MPLATPLSRNPGSATDWGSLQRSPDPLAGRGDAYSHSVQGDWRPCSLVLFFIYSLVLCELKPGNRKKQPKCLFAVRRRRNLVYAKDTFSIHTRKQCMLQHTQHIGLRRLCHSSTTSGLRTVKHKAAAL